MKKDQAQVKENGANSNVSTTAPRKKVSQTDVPGYSIEQALRVPRAIAENYAFKPAQPLDVAVAMNMSPTSGTFRGITGAAIAYGLTTGASNAPEISITPLGMRIVRPLDEGDDLAAKQEALLKPRVFAEFLNKYQSAQLPKNDIARNVLLSMGVPQDRTAVVLQLLLESAEAVGFIKQIKDKRYLDLKGVPRSSDTQTEEEVLPEPEHVVPNDKRERSNPQGPVPFLSTPPASNRVFITHGKNTAIVEQLKELLTFGNFVPIVAAEHETVSKPVPDKVMDDMRSCYAAIIHVGKEIKMLDQEGKEHIFLNQNVLIEIGAAMALYTRRFILLVERGASLPSNLQGLYEVRYEGDRLDYDATMKLLKAFNEFKT